MALIPLKEIVKITKETLTTNGTIQLDDWGQPITNIDSLDSDVSLQSHSAINGEPLEYKCRIDELTNITKNQFGQEVVSNTRILIEGVADIDYGDKVTYTDANGVERTYKPIKISIIKDISSKPLFTEVEL
jgi:hypothetical protein